MCVYIYIYIYIYIYVHTYHKYTYLHTHISRIPPTSFSKPSTYRQTSGSNLTVETPSCGVAFQMLSLAVSLVPHFWIFVPKIHCTGLLEHPPARGVSYDQISYIHVYVLVSISWISPTHVGRGVAQINYLYVDVLMQLYTRLRIWRNILAKEWLESMKHVDVLDAPIQWYRVAKTHRIP